MFNHKNDSFRRLSSGCSGATTRRLLRIAGAFLPEPREPRVLMSADPVTADHPLWLVPRGSAVIDGVANEAAWDSAGEVLRTQATRDDRAVVVKMMYDDNGVYLM